jgi:hypothetical protein
MTAINIVLYYLSGTRLGKRTAADVHRIGDALI